MSLVSSTLVEHDSLHRQILSKSELLIFVIGTMLLVVFEYEVVSSVQSRDRPKKQVVRTPLCVCRILVDCSLHFELFPVHVFFRNRTQTDVARKQSADAVRYNSTCWSTTQRSQLNDDVHSCMSRSQVWFCREEQGHVFFETLVQLVVPRGRRWSLWHDDGTSAPSVGQ